MCVQLCRPCQILLILVVTCSSVSAQNAEDRTAEPTAKEFIDNLLEIRRKADAKSESKPEHVHFSVVVPDTVPGLDVKQRILLRAMYDISLSGRKEAPISSVGVFPYYNPLAEKDQGKLGAYHRNGDYQTAISSDDRLKALGRDLRATQERLETKCRIELSSGQQPALLTPCEHCKRPHFVKGKPPIYQYDPSLDRVTVVISDDLLWIRCPRCQGLGVDISKLPPELQRIVNSKPTEEAEASEELKKILGLK